MKLPLTILLVLAIAFPALAGGTFVVTNEQYIVISGNVSDTLGRTRLTPDSVRIVVTDSAGTELNDAWYNSGDAQATVNGDVLTFFDQFNDINGGAEIGVFSLMATFASDNQGSVDLYSNQNYVVICTDTTLTHALDASVASNVLSISGSATAADNLEEAYNGDATPAGYVQNTAQIGGTSWSPIVDNDSLIVDQTTMVAIGDTIQTDLSGLDGWSPILDNDSLIVDQSSLEDLALASRSAIGDTIQTDLSGLDGWTPIIDNESLVVDQSTMVAVGDTNQVDLSNYDGTTPFDYTTDVVVASDTIQSGDSIATLDDSTAFQGSAASLDSTAVYGAVVQANADSLATIDEAETLMRAAAGDTVSAYALDSATVYGAVAQANEDSSISKFDASTDVVVASDTIQSGDSIATLDDSTAFQGSASSLDSTAVYGAVTQANEDSSISTFDASTDVVVAADTVQSGDSIATLADSSAFQGAASSLDSAAVYGAVTQANEDSSISTFDPTTDIVVASDTIQSGDSIATLDDSTAFQGSASSLDSSAVYGAVTQANEDSSISTFDPATDVVVASDTIQSGDSIATLDDSTAFQGSGADSSPSSWDATDSLYVYNIHAQLLADSLASITMDSVRDALADTGRVIAGDSIFVDVRAISGDAAAADSLEYQIHDASQTLIEQLLTIITYTDGDASEGIELQIDKNHPSEWDQADSNKFYGLVWSAAVDTPKIIDPAMTNGDSIGTHPSAWTAAETTVYQGSGADATPSQWDVTDSGIVQGLVWETLVSTQTTDGSFGDSIITLLTDIEDDSASGIDSATTYGAVVDALTDDIDVSFDSAAFRILTISNNTADPAFSVQNSAGHATYFRSTGGIGKSGLYLEGQGASSNGLQIVGNTQDIVGSFQPSNFENDTFDSLTFDATYWEKVANVADSGSAASIDSEEVARAVWDNDVVSQANRTVTAVAGDGANLCSLYVYSGSGSIGGASITMTKGVDSWDNLSNSAGWVVFSLENGTWYGTAYKTAFTQDTIPQTFSISAAIKDTITMSATSVGSPGNAQLCSVYIYTYGIVGDTVEGATFRAIPRGRGAWIDTNNVAVMPSEKTARSDSNGYAALAVYKSALVRQLQSDGTQGGDSLKYDFILTKPRHFEWKAENRVVPADSSVWWVK